MICSNCGYDNPRDMLFCGMCGSQIAQECPNCQSGLPLDFRYCGKCGIALNGSTRIEISPSPMLDGQVEIRGSKIPQKREYESGANGSTMLMGERRFATILVADVKSSTQLMEKLVAAEGALTQSMGKFFALAEQYPDIKADSTMNNLMEELTSTENKVSFSRQAYNDAVMLYNTAIEVFPSNIVAGMFNFAHATLFEVESPEVKKAVKVSFE